jgi:hypothetical protein
VVKNRRAFQQRYGTGLPVVGEYDGNLSNGGENLVLSGFGTTLLDLTYGTAAPWPDTADGAGNSLEIVDWNSEASSATNWRASAEMHGTPGRVTGAELRLQAVQLEGQRVRLQFLARAGRAYVLEFKSDLNSSPWSSLMTFAAADANELRVHEEPIPVGVSQRFYRLSSP